MIKRIIIFLCVLCGLTTAQARDRQCFDKNWRFNLGDSAIHAKADFDDSKWRLLDVPHDWAIEGDFYVSNPSGAGGGALPGGIGWYRKHFTLGDCETPMKETKFFIEFDGVYMNSTVYVNGQEVGHRPYGYSSFEYDITPYVHEGENVVAVKVDNSDQPNSRWYSGCGIYRHVWLTKTHPVHVAHWGTNVVPTVAKGKGKLDIEVSLVGQGTVENTLIDPNGRVVGKSKGQKSSITISKPMLWSCETPYLYKVRTDVKVGGKVVDTYETTTGFRSFKFDTQTGFWLNGKNFKLNGVCEHHDFGCLGAAVHEDALHRKLSKLKAMGVNSIRSSHNPPAPELLNMCDSMGLIVMDESFDMWRRKKTQNDYARFFDEWHERDLTDLVVRDRNHPCILMWSIGNEVLEQWSGTDNDELSLEQANLLLNASRDASTLAKDGDLSPNSLLTIHLADIIRRNDGAGRPILAGCNEPSPNNHLFKSGAIDIIGFNYHHQWVKDVPKNFPNKPFIFSESVSGLQTRGYYKMPSDSVFWAPKEWYLPYTDPSYMCSAYDNMHASWSSTHEETWDVVKHTPYVGGQYIWTGWDYIGEPTPYGFPARSSYFGIIDLAGFPKDTYYMYQSEWTETPVLHLFPHWNWLPGETIDMWCYYNQADEVELFINGKSQGVRRKTDEQSEGRFSMHNTKTKLNSEYHVGWRVTFEPGEVKAVARKDGKVVGEHVIRTAGQPERIRLSIDYQGKDLTFVIADVVDARGNLCPLAEDQISFSVDGDAEIIGTDNGCQTSMERFTSPQRKAFFGRCMVVVRGKGTLKAQSPMLRPASTVVLGTNADRSDLDIVSVDRISVSEEHEQMQTGKYQPTWESLETHQTPEWFRDAKFGIWAHWGPQCVEGSGDWMARSLYMEGSREYKYHVEHYGHPSEFGFKDILPLFKAEKWNPEALLEKYKRCGAQYFFVLGNHHDNYDLWDSKYQPWNSKNIGPKRDILDEWAKAAKKVGLPLGISFHADHAWTWYEPSQRYDLEGPKAGVYYDGHLTKEDGKGKWWEGLDPQMLYQQNHPMSKGSWDNGAIHGQWAWGGGACPPSQTFVTNFYDRTLDAINRYQPDLIYFDVTVLPFYPISDCGMKIAAHMYNKNPRSVVFGKILSDEQRKALTWDVERGAPNEIIPEPWQTCNCIGGWHYNTDIYEKGQYKSAATVVKQLVDIVSKNGNLLLSVPLRADGTYDEKEAVILDDLEAWMSVNGESIFGTRPWVKFGEGPVAEKDIKINAQGFNDGQFANMDYRDIRFNQTKKHLYVTAMGWPEDGKLVIKSLAKGNKDFKKAISSVQLLGYGKLKSIQTAEGLVVMLPQPTNKIAPVLKITK